MAGIYRRPVGRLARKESEISEIRSTPIDELSSWLPDDVCTNCGATTLRGKLFCSEDCKLADARQMSHDADVETLAPVHPVETSDLKFRYACPPSPSLLAQISPMHKALTSPALDAHQSSLPRLGRLSTLDGPKKRSSSQSTFSSASDSNGSAILSTDPSTPSPAYGPTEDESDLDAIDFQLPPSISSASAVMLRRASKSQHDSPPAPRSTEVRTPKSPLWYARRPSTTAARGSFYTSPAVIATSKVTATRRDSPATSTNISPSATRSDPMRKAAKDLLSGALDSRAPALTTGFEKTSIAVRRNHSQDAGTRSPQAVHSAASSAGKTMRATSPPGSRPFSPLTTDGCDRCRTLSNISGELDIYASSFVSSHSRVPSSSSDERRKMQSHKHSHSAAAALLFTQVYTPDDKAARPVSPSAAKESPVTSALANHSAPYKATPPRGRSKARGRSSQRRSPSPPRAAARRDSSAKRDLSPAPISPRSHPISISTRSPRLAGDEDALFTEQELRSDRPDRPQNPSPLAVITAQKIAPSELAARGRSRGRSHRRERESRERGSTSRTRWVHKDCELSWAAYGHRDADRGDEAAAKARTRRPGAKEFADPGFDDIDLELDGDDERGGALSSGGSVESLPTRGRAPLRT